MKQVGMKTGLESKSILMFIIYYFRVSQYQKIIDEQQQKIKELQEQQEQQQKQFVQEQLDHDLKRRRHQDNHSMNTEQIIHNIDNIHNIDKETEREIKQFIYENPNLIQFVKKNLRMKGGDPFLNKRLVKYFVENVDYFKHLSGKCVCFQCKCGKCKCNYVRLALNDSYNTQYKNHFKVNNQISDNLLKLKQEKINQYNFMGPDRQNVLDIYKTEAKEKYQIPGQDDYVQRRRLRDGKMREPSLIKSSEYGIGYVPYGVNVKDDMLRQDHFIVQDTRLLGKSTKQNDYRNNGKAQEHHQRIQIKNPLYVTICNSRMNEELPVVSEKQNVYRLESVQQKQKDNFNSGDNLTAPQHYLSEHKKGYQLHQIQTCPGQKV